MKKETKTSEKGHLPDPATGTEKQPIEWCVYRYSVKSSVGSEKGIGGKILNKGRKQYKALLLKAKIERTFAELFPGSQNAIKVKGNHKKTGGLGKKKKESSVETRLWRRRKNAGHERRDLHQNMRSQKGGKKGSVLRCKNRIKTKKRGGKSEGGGFRTVGRPRSKIKLPWSGWQGGQYYVKNLSGWVTTKNTHTSAIEEAERGPKKFFFWFILFDERGGERKKEEGTRRLLKLGRKIQGMGKEAGL